MVYLAAAEAPSCARNVSCMGRSDAAPVACRSSAACHVGSWAPSEPSSQWVLYRACLSCLSHAPGGSDADGLSRFVLTIGTSRSGIFLETHLGLNFPMMRHAIWKADWEFAPFAEFLLHEWFLLMNNIAEVTLVLS